MKLQNAFQVPLWLVETADVFRENMFQSKSTK